jgi:hypothetical protein
MTDETFLRRFEAASLDPSAIATTCASPSPMRAAAASTTPSLGLARDCGASPRPTASPAATTRR